MFLLLCSVGNGDIISNEGLLTVAGLKVEQLQENKDKKKEQGIMLLLGGGVGLWTDEDHPWDCRSRRNSSFRHVSVSSGVLAGREKEQKRHHWLPGTRFCCCVTIKWKMNQFGLKVNFAYMVGRKLYFLAALAALYLLLMLTHSLLGFVEWSWLTPWPTIWLTPWTTSPGR